MIGTICSIVSITLASSINSFLWQLISFIWPWKWLWILGIFLSWIIWELRTRNGISHYNSANGFSPTFNKFVGSGTYIMLQSATLLFFVNFFGEFAYCMRIPYIIHLLIFLSTGYFLHKIGFWPHWNKPRIYRKRRK